MPKRSARTGGGRLAVRFADAAEAPFSLLERMPVELLVMIMECCNNPEDLFNLVMVCSTINSVFRMARRQILNSVIRNALPGTNFRDACWALRAAVGTRALMSSKELYAIDESQRPVPGRRTQAEIIADLQTFVDKYHESYLDPAASIADVTSRTNRGLVGFFRLWWVINHWTKKHQAGAQEMLYTYANQLHRPNSKSFGYSAPAPPPGVSTPSPLPCKRPLSRDETMRIQRAFLRFEIFRCLVPPEFMLLSIPAARTVVDGLRLTFVTWEWVELYSIGHFLIGEVGELLGTVQDQAASKLADTVHWNPPANPVTTDQAFGLIKCDFLCRGGDPSIPHLQWMLFRLAHLGLPFLSLLQKSPFELQKVLISDYCNMQYSRRFLPGNNFLTTFITGATFSWTLPGRQAPLSLAALKMQEAMPGPGAGWERWRWHSIDRGFECTAFNMWDKERLKDAKLYRQVPLPALLRGRRKGEKNARKLANGLRRIVRMHLGDDCGARAYEDLATHDQTHRHTQRIVWANEYVSKKEEEVGEEG